MELSRSSYYYASQRKEVASALKNTMLELYEERPFYEHRQMRVALTRLCPGAKADPAANARAQEALEEALKHYGKPAIFNTDQGSQFNSAEFSGLLEAKGIQISMKWEGVVA